jgi:hypothetical protein
MRDTRYQIRDTDTGCEVRDAVPDADRDAGYGNWIWHEIGYRYEMRMQYEIWIRNAGSGMRCEYGVHLRWWHKMGFLTLAGGLKNILSGLPVAPFIFKNILLTL